MKVPIMILTALLSVAPVQASQSLQAIYALALEHDGTLAAARESYRAQRETEHIARAALLPQVSASAEFARERSERQTESVFELQGQQVPSRTDDDTSADSRTLALHLEQPLFDAPAWYTYRAGQTRTAQASAQLRIEQQALIQRVAQAYVDVLRARANFTAAEAEERSAARQLEQARVRFEVGQIAVTDVHEARAVHDATVAQRLGFEAELGIARHALSVLTGQEHPGPLAALSEDFPVTEPVPRERHRWVEHALVHNPTLAAAQEEAHAAQQRAAANRAEHLPRVSAALNYTDFQEDGESERNLSNTIKPFDTRSEGVSVSLRLSLPLYAGGGVSAARRQAVAEYNAARQRALTTRREVVHRTRAAHLRLLTDVQTVKARTQGVVSAKIALEATEAGYKVGSRNLVDVLQAVRAHYAAIRDLANARLDYVLDWLSLQEEAGLLSPASITEIERWLDVP